MKRSEAIKLVITELRGIKRNLLKGNKVSSLKFVNLSEIFKFQIDPKKHRFNALCLDEAAKANSVDKITDIVNEILTTEEHDCEKIHPDMSHEEWEESQEGEVNELVDFDGTVQSSKIPMGTEQNKTMSSKQTTDDVIRTGTQAGSLMGAGSYFRRYYSESVDEADLSKSLGYEETKDFDAEETIDYFEKEHDMETIEAKERAESMGKTEKLDDRGGDDENYQRLTEREKLRKIAEDRAKDMIEVLLSKKSEDGELPKKTVEDSQLDKLMDKLITLATNKGISIASLISTIRSKKNE